MKNLILLFCLMFVSSKIYSQIFTENFDYAPSTVLSATAAWDVSSSGGTNALTVSNTGLSFPDYSASGIGNSLPLLTTGEDDSAAISPRQIVGNVYASFMMKVSAAQTTGDYFFALSTSGNSLDARVYVKAATGGFVMGITKANEATVTYGTTVYSFGTTYLVIDKYTFNGAALDDQVSLFVFDPASPPPVSEPAPTIGPVTSTATDANNISRIILRQGGTGSSATLVIDGIYVDNVWNSLLLPVELSSFTYSNINRDVILNWSTVFEINNASFEIEKRDARSETQDVWRLVGNVAGNGTSNVSHYYSFTDRNLNSGKYYYRLKQIDFNGNFEYFNLQNEINIGTPLKFSLSQNYPNPFNPSTSINFSLPTDSKVSLKIYDMSGKEVANLLNDVKTAGYYSINSNASSLSSGIYFYSISAGNFTA
ncbi:MAG: T9SS type A sorting domain-containing protein, partial [Ignavibacteria bacterium]|nr:T9SS type A sorting domain-containing protein [Ignavibacteria bacterium]